MRGRTSSKKVAPFGRPRALPLTPIADRDSDRRRGKVSTPVGLAKLKTTRLLASLRNCTPINLSLFRGLRLAPMLQQPSLVFGCQCARSHPQMKASVPRPRSLRNNRTRTKTTSRSCFTRPLSFRNRYQSKARRKSVGVGEEAGVDISVWPGVARPRKHTDA